MMGFPTGTTSAQIETVLPDEQDDDENPGGSKTFEREDVEVGIDVFISTLIQNNVIKQHRRGKQPSLEDVFEHIFGENHEITKTAKSFEEHIEGYFEVVGYED